MQKTPRKIFLPAPGTVEKWVPSGLGNARFDSGVESGSVIGTQFDPMIAKVIVHAPTRREAAARLARVLETTEIQGLTTNRDFLVATLRTPEYLSGDTTTDFIERVEPARTRAVPADEYRDACIAAALESQAHNRAKATINRNIPSGWRNSIMPPQRRTFVINDEDLLVEYQCLRSGRFEFTIGNDTLSVECLAAGNGQVDMSIDGLRQSVRANLSGNTWNLQGHRGAVSIEERPRFALSGGTEAGGGQVAPMPGAVLAIEVGEGDNVSKGDLLLILEAMKMEHRITAPTNGIVENVHVATGDQVENGQLLVTITEK